LLLDSTLFLFLLSPRPSSPLFPYTTLFRSILSVLDRAFDDADKRPITLLYGARTEDELYCLERLLSWTKSIHTFSFIPVLSHEPDRKSTRLNSSHVSISYAVFCLKKKNSND